MPNEYIQMYENLIFKLAGKFYNADREDLIQAGFLGLSKAYKNYNKSVNTKFSSYAYEYIYGEMYEVANGTRPIKLRKELMSLYKKISETKELLSQKYKKEISFSEAAKFLHINESLLNDILNSLSASISIEETEINVSYKDNIDDLILLKESLIALEDTERSVIESRYISDLSQEETAKKLKLTQVKVSRIEKRSKEKIKNFINS